MNINQALAASNLRNLTRDQIECGLNIAARRMDSVKSNHGINRAEGLYNRLVAEAKSRGFVVRFGPIDGYDHRVGNASEFEPVSA